MLFLKKLLDRHVFVDAKERFLARLKTLGRDVQGNLGLTFAVLAVPLIFGMGAALDYTRSYNARVEMQANLDEALIAAIKLVDTLNEADIKVQIANWFSAQHQTTNAPYILSTDSIVVDKSNRTIKAYASATVPTTFLGIANIRNVDVRVSSTVAGPATSYLNVYIVLDKSASMLLAADSSGQAAMKNSSAGCVFACHIAEGSSHPYNGVNYATNYTLSRAMGVKLRADVSVSAAKEVLSMIAASDPTQSRIKVGLYTIGNTATEVLAPTYSTSTAKTTLDTDSKGLNSATSQTASSFNVTLPALNSLVGAAGDGTSAANPLKLVLLLTDGVISERDWVLNGVWWDSSGAMNDGKDWYRVSPINPTWCSGMKTNKVTVGVLYTEYLAIPTDQGYIHTVGGTMRSADWAATWGATIRKTVSDTTSRRDYIPYALQDCASSSEMFISASDSTKIEKGLSSLFQTYLGYVRLTQ